MDWNIATPKGALTAAMSTSCGNLVNFSPVTPEFTVVVEVHPLLDQHLNWFIYVRLLTPVLDIGDQY